MKRCFHCHTSENLMVNGRKPNGRINYICRACNTERLRRYRKTDEGIKNTYAAVLAFNKRHPNKRHSYQIVRDALKSGKLRRPSTCSACHQEPTDGRAVDAHHFDYKLPLVVIWLCRQCHANVHNGSLDITKLIEKALRIAELHRLTAA